jgi:hypothetical protein
VFDGFHGRLTFSLSTKAEPRANDLIVLAVAGSAWNRRATKIVDRSDMRRTERNVAFGLDSLRSRKNFPNEAKVAVLIGAFALVGLTAYQYAPGGKMLILRGVAAENAPRGQLDDQAALTYARVHGYSGEVLDVGADTGPQVKLALERIRNDRRVSALYGFSGGGFNAVAVWNQLTPDEKKRIRKIVVVGAPGISKASFPGVADVTVKEDPPEGHMAGPRELLEEGKLLANKIVIPGAAQYEVVRRRPGIHAAVTTDYCVYWIPGSLAPLAPRNDV